MKWICCLILAMLIASPALGQATLKEVDALLAAYEARMIAEFQKINTELAELKTDVVELKTDVAVLKTELGMLKVEVADLKTEVQHLDDKLDLVANTATGTQSEVRGNSTRTSELHSQMNSQTHALLLVAGLLATVLLWMLKKEWDARREERAKNAEQEKENAALRAENERLRNASGLVSSTGGKLEVD